MNTRYGVASLLAILLSAIFTLSGFAQSQTTGRIAGTVRHHRQSRWLDEWGRLKGDHPYKLAFDITAA